MNPETPTTHKHKSSLRKLRLRHGEVGLGVRSALGLLAVYGVALAAVSLWLRSDLRQQILEVDANVLRILVANQIDRAEQEALLLYEYESLGEMELWGALLETSTAEGVFALQYFDPFGVLQRSSSDGLLGGELPEAMLRPTATEQAHTVFRPDARLSDFLGRELAADESVALLEVYVPLKSGELGTVRYLMDGASLATQFSRLDGRLARQVGIAALVGSAALLSLFFLAWRRLGEANLRLRRQAEGLEKANRELAMLARTSAVGSVTAHLIHGLKNPLAGLRQVVSSGGEALGEEDWRGASEAADRMQRLVEEVIAVLQDESSGVGFAMHASEVAAELESRFAATARKRDVRWEVVQRDDFEISSRVANIVLLVASNIARNAFEATPVGGEVRLILSAKAGEGMLRVEDSGAGIAEDLREGLFTPVSSSKKGGAGIGLAISAQLARHLGGRLVSRDGGSSLGGACFELVFPLVDEAGGGA